MEFTDPELVPQIRTTIDEFIEQEIEPLENEYNQFLGEDSEMHLVDGAGTDYRLCDEFVDLWQEIRERSAQAGIYTMHLPERVGGGGLDVLPYVMLIEYLENRNPDGFHPLMTEINVNEVLLPAYEDDYQREHYFEPTMTGEKLPATAISEIAHGSEATFMDTSATREDDTWLINGKKAWISKGAIADFYIVFARTSNAGGEIDGITAFLVDSDTPGVSVEKVHRPMGGLPGQQAILNFEDCAVSPDQVLGTVDEGFPLLIQTVGFFRATVAAEAIGRSQWLLDETLDYASQRETFGNKIGSYQGIQFPIAEAATDIEQARLLNRYAAWKQDNGERAVKEQSMAKLRAAEIWTEMADLAIQVHGAAGYMRSLPFEKDYREARSTRIKDGTDEIQKRTIAKELFGGSL